MSLNLAFFSRSIYSFGYQEAINWIQQAHSKWTASLNDYKLVSIIFFLKNKRCFEFKKVAIFLFHLHLVWKCHVFMSLLGPTRAPTGWASFLHFSLSRSNFVARCSLIPVWSSIAFYQRCSGVSSSSGSFSLSLEHSLCYMFMVYAKYMSKPFVLSGID